MKSEQTITCGNNLDVLKTYPDNHFDSVVTDPPYGISFMNKHWDYDVPTVELWKEVIRVLKPGGHMLCACGTRTQHRMVVNIEDAGFEIRDVISWIYGSGFPKSMDISKAIDKQAGAEREKIKNPLASKQTAQMAGKGLAGAKAALDFIEPNPATKEANHWQGYGTGLKPATEFWTLARKPISENTIADNVLKWGTGGINIDTTRIATNDNLNGGGSVTNASDGWDRPFRNDESKKDHYKEIDAQKLKKAESLGRFPANLILDEFTAALLDEQSGELTSGAKNGNYNSWGDNGIYGSGKEYQQNSAASSGGASRFFYVAKPSVEERNRGLNKFQKRKVNDGRQTVIDNAFQRGETERGNTHPTVKPIQLMRYLVKMITPPKGICLDPYMGSGTTIIACKLELFNGVGIDREQEYCDIVHGRIKKWNPDLYKVQVLF